MYRRTLSSLAELPRESGHRQAVLGKVRNRHAQGLVECENQFSCHQFRIPQRERKAPEYSIHSESMGWYVVRGNLISPLISLVPAAKEALFGSLGMDAISWRYPIEGRAGVSLPTSRYQSINLCQHLVAYEVSPVRSVDQYIYMKTVLKQRPGHCLNTD